MKKFYKKIVKISKERIIVIALLLFIVVQLFYLFFSPFVFYHEDQKVATLGIDLLQGRLRLPLWFYLDSPHAGGSILSALVSIPFYLIFGQIYLALKMAGLFLAALIFLIWARFLVKEYGPKILVPFVLIFTLPPTRLLLHYFIRIGNTVELILAISLTLIFGYLFLKGGAKDYQKALFLGFIFGLGLWIQYAFIAAILTILLAWFLVDKKFLFKRIFLIFLGGFIIGLSPLLIFNLQYNFASFRADQLVDYNILGVDFGLLLNRVVRFFSSVLPRSFMLLGTAPLGENVVSLVFYFFIFLSFIALFISSLRNKKAFDSILLIYLLISFFLINFLNVPLNIPFDRYIKLEEITAFSYYYLGFLLPFLLISLTIFVFKLVDSKNRIFNKSAYVIIMILFIVLGNNFLKNISISNIRGIKGRTLGLATDKPMVDSLDIYPINTRLFFNRYLFQPHENINANAYEAGFHFSRDSSLFGRLIDELDPKYRRSFILGAAYSSNYLLRKGNLDEEERHLIYLISNLSAEEKQLFFYKVLVGESFWIGGDKSTILRCYSQFTQIRDLQPADKVILDNQLDRVLAEWDL